MKKTAKTPRTFARCKAKAKQVKKQQLQSRVIDEKAIEFLEQMSPGFAAFYRESYDSEGKYVGQRIPGLLG